MDTTAIMILMDITITTANTLKKDAYIACIN